MPFWQFFRMGLDGSALLVPPSIILHRNSKNIFVLGADYSLERLEGKTRKGPFSKVQSGKITVWLAKNTNSSQRVLNCLVLSAPANMIKKYSGCGDLISILPHAYFMLKQSLLTDLIFKFIIFDDYRIQITQNNSNASVHKLYFYILEVVQGCTI